MKILVNTVELLSELRINELNEPTDKFRKKFGEFSFACGCGNAHRIVKQTYKSPAFSNTFWSDPTKCVFAIAQENSRILFSCWNGFFTMVGRQAGVLKATIETDFTIDRSIIDNHDNGLGLIISTDKFNLDFNVYGKRKVPIPQNELTSWDEFEKSILEAGSSSLSRLPGYIPEFEGMRFSCPCGTEHFMEGTAPIYAIQQGPKREFCYPHIVCGGKGCKNVIYRCHNGYYCMIRMRPSLPVVWFFKSEIMPANRRSKTTLPEEIFKEFEGLKSLLASTSSIRV